MYALIDDQGAFVRACYDDRCEWGGAYHSSLRLMLSGERRRFKVYDLIDSEGSYFPGAVAIGERVVVDHAGGTVTRTRQWRAPTEEETAAKEKSEAQIGLQALELSTVRVLEDLVDVLVEKGTISLTDLPVAARKKLSDRKTLRAVLSK